MSPAETQILTQLQQILPPDHLLTGDAVRRVYSTDAYTVDQFPPLAVALPSTTQQAAQIAKICHQHQIPLTPRGAGTGLSGGAMPALGGIVLSTKKLTQIIEIDIPNRALLAQAGVVNTKISAAVKNQNLHFAPDPSSQSVSTLGGNIAENSGGPHTLKYGVTANHILGLTIVLPHGEILELGSRHGPDPSLDLISLIVGSEGLLGTVTEAWVKLTPLPKSIQTALVAFPTIEDATKTVSAIIQSGVLPAALEMMDKNVLTAVSAAFDLKYPPQTQALLLIETDGPPDQSLQEIQQVQSIAQLHNALSIQIAKDEQERTKLWTARKKGVGALGRLAPTVVTHDGVIPPSKLPQMLAAVYQIAEKYDIGVANIFHAGDGNLHPIFYFDQRIPGKVDAVVAAGEEIIEKCLALGGSVTGEHGVGVEKASLLNRQFDPPSLALQAKIPLAFHHSPVQNPCKVIPQNKSCTEHKVRWRGAAT